MEKLARLGAIVDHKSAPLRPQNRFNEFVIDSIRKSFL